MVWSAWGGRQEVEKRKLSFQLADEKTGHGDSNLPKMPSRAEVLFYPIYLRPVPVQQFILYLIAVIFKRKKKSGGEEEAAKLLIYCASSFVFCQTVIAGVLESSCMHAVLV